MVDRGRGRDWERRGAGIEGRGRGGVGPTEGAGPVEAGRGRGRQGRGRQGRGFQGQGGQRGRGRQRLFPSGQVGRCAGGRCGRNREGQVLPARCGGEPALWRPQVMRVRGRLHVAFLGAGMWGQFRDWRKARGRTLLLGPQVGQGGEGGQ